jgi:hypothetical protein
MKARKAEVLDDNFLCIFAGQAIDANCMDRSCSYKITGIDTSLAVQFF